MLTVVVIDDHKVVRAAIKSLLETGSNIKVVSEAATGAEGLRNVRQFQPDVVLLDIDLPDISGLDIAKRLLHYNDKCKIIILTSYLNGIFSSRFLQMGVVGYLPKDCDAKQLIEAVSQVHKGQKFISSGIAEQIVLKNTSKPDLLDVLSDRELELMMHVARGDKAETLAAKFHLSQKTINGNRSKIFKKLGVKSDVDLTHLALQYGLLSSEMLQ